MSDLAPSWLCEQIEQVLRHLIFLPGTPDLIYLLVGHQKSGLNQLARGVSDQPFCQAKELCNRLDLE
ncbi:Uncharacterised protein [Pseudomonas aeruginosa]|nr:Uncharacterised protein [Pseudomonas aeruginosa]